MAEPGTRVASDQKEGPEWFRRIVAKGREQRTLSCRKINVRVESDQKQTQGRVASGSAVSRIWFQASRLAVLKRKLPNRPMQFKR